MICPRTVRAARRTVVIGGLGLAGVALLGACASGADDATSPPAISAAGQVTLPADVVVTRPPEDDPAEAPADPAETPVEAPAEDPIQAPTDEPVDQEADALPVDTAAEDDAGWWPWLLVLVGSVAAIVGLVLSRTRRKNSEWTARALATFDASDALTTHLLALAPDGLIVVARADALRLTELDATARDLVDTAPDDRARAAIDGVRTPLAQLHTAVDMVSLAPIPTGPQLTFVHQWASALHAATATSRAMLSAPYS